jgi:outer membrane protein assembly factor BamB
VSRGGRHRLVRLVRSAVVTVTSVMVVFVLAGTGNVLSTPASAAPNSDAGGWTIYHHDPAGRGVALGVTAVDTRARAWTSPVLDGSLYGESLVTGGTVYVATEANAIYALSAATGAIVWSRHLGPAVPAADLPCGNITPTVGITGTPAIDPARGELFVVADELVGGNPSHRLVGLNLVTGATEMTQAVDPAGATPAALLQRTGLALDAGRVVLGFGGNYGDCAPYRGLVVSVGEGGGTPVDFAVDAASDESQGAIWMGGAAPAVDAAGNIWVSAGNGSVTSDAHPYDHSDSVLELSPSLRLEQFFAPSNWTSNNAADLDLSMAPALLANGQVVIAGKARLAYLLDGAHLGGIGGQLATVGPMCGDDVAGGSATVGTTVYLPCLSGIVAVRTRTAPASMRVLWSSSTGGGPPIVAGGLVWTIGQDGVLSGLDPETGAVRREASVGRPANHFPTPSVGDGVLLAASANRVVAFSATTGTSAPSTTRAGRTDPSVVSSGGGAGPGPPLAAVAGGLVLLGASAWWWRRRRQTRSADRGP